MACDSKLERECTIKSDLILDILHREIQRTTGCTDPGTVSLAVARARRALGQVPDHVAVIVSANLYKNAACVGVPGTGMTGLPIACALGAFLDHYESGLDILNHLTPQTLSAAQQMINAGEVEVKWENTPDLLYVRAEVRAGADTAYAVISGDYTNIVEVGVNGAVTEQIGKDTAKPEKISLVGYKLRDLFMAVEALDVNDLRFLVDVAQINREAARTSVNDSGLQLGQSLHKRMVDTEVSIMDKAQAWTGAAGEARMSGRKVPIMAIAGSGNQGITSFLGVLAAAEDLQVDDDMLARALAVSTIFTIYIKSHMTRLSALCGCTLAAAPSVSAAITYMLEGSYEDMEHAMQTVIGTLVGMLCDGAKESCAYKLSLAVNFSVQAAFMSLEDAYIRPGSGLISANIEDTIANLGTLNQAMLSVDQEVIKMIEEGRKSCGIG